MKTQIQTRIGLAMALTLALLAGLAPRAEAAGYQMPITFSGYTNRNETLTNFPVLVVFSNGVGSSGFSFATMPFATASGYDLRFYTNATDTGSGLDYEVESWNATAASYVWVRVPLIPSNGTGAIWAKWGDSANSSQLACTTNGAVWTNGFGAVWHLNEAVTPGATVTNAYKDATPNLRHAKQVGVSPANGLAGGGMSADGNDSNAYRVELPASATSNRTIFTAGLWVKTTESRTTGGSSYGDQYWNKRTLLGEASNNDHSGDWGLKTAGGKIGFWHGLGTTDRNYDSPGLSINDGTSWHQVALVSDNVNMSLYVDGAYVAQLASGSYGTDASARWLGGMNYGDFGSGGGTYHQGAYDEVRISTIARSTNWLWAEYATMASNTLFSTYGTASVVDVNSPQIQNQAPSGVMTNGATFNGYLVTNGTSAATVYVAWDQTNGSVSGSWAATNWWNPGDWTNGSYPSTNMALSPNANYYYTFGATNSTTNVTAGGCQYLITGEVTVQASDPTGRTNAGDTAAFTVYRPASCTNEDLTVNYTLSGTATNVTDYTVPSTNTVTMSAGQTSTNIVVTPVYRESIAQTVVLTLAPGFYAIGAQNSATCTLATVATANRYWVAPGSGNWSDTNNWSYFTGQPGGWSVPGSGSIAFFDNGGSGDCAMNTAVNVAGLVLTNGYAGTVTQGAATPITVGASGWSQSTGTFSGSTNTITLGLGSPSTTGPWILSGGTFNAGNQTINVNGKYMNSSWTYSGGTFNAGGSTVSLWADNSTITISGSQTFNNLTMNGVYQTHWSTYTVPTGTTLTVTNTLSLLDGGAANAGFGFGGTGTIAAKGNITASYLRAGNAYFGTVFLLINGTGDQTFTNAGAALSRIEINKPSGTLSLAGTHRVGAGYSDSGYWTYTAGTLNAGASTITFFGDNGGLIISGSHTLGNVSFVNIGATHVNNMTIAAGTTLTAAGTLSFNAASGGSSIPINTGTLNAQGDVSFSVGAPCGGTAAFTFTGAATQQVSYAGTPNYCQFSPITVNKTGGALNLATDLSLGNAGQKLVWTNGAVNLSSNTLTVAGATTIYPGATTLGVTVADTNKAGRLMCSSAVSNIANVGLEVTVAAAKAQSAQLQGQTYTILSNNASFGATTFESETWLGAWRGSVAYTNNGGKTVTLSNIRFIEAGMMLMVQ